MFEFILNNDVEGLRNALADLADTWSLQQRLAEKNAEGQTLMHVAVASGSLPHVQTLLAWDASTTAVDNEGRTSRTLAEERSNTDDAEQANNYRRIAALIRTRQEWQDIALGFRFNRVVYLIKEAFPAIKPASGKDKVLFIGRTGAGKTTLLKYLNGTRYVTGDNPRTGRRFARPAENTTAEIGRVGQGMIPQTLYPQVLTKEPLNYVYCDLAGLFNSQGAEERICAASSVQMLSRLPGNIKGIIVVLDLPSLQPVGRGEGFKKTAVALVKMLQENAALMNSVYFVITQVPNEVLDTLDSGAILEECVDGILAGLNDKARTQALNRDEQALKFMLAQMQRMGAERILIANISDQGQHRQTIENALTHLPAQDPNLFNFVEHDGSQESFNFVLSTIARKYLTQKRKLALDIPQKIATEQQIQNEKNMRIAELEGQIADLGERERSPFVPDLINREIERRQRMIADNSNAIAQRERDIARFARELPALRNDLRDIAARDDIRRLNNEIAALNDEINTCRAQIRAGEENAEVIRNQLREAIAHCNERLDDARLERAESVERQRAHENERTDIQLELEVNQDLFKVIYEVSHILDLGNNDFGIFWREYEREHPNAANDLAAALEPNAMGLNNNHPRQQAPRGNGIFFHPDPARGNASNNNAQHSNQDVPDLRT